MRIRDIKNGETSFCTMGNRSKRPQAIISARIPNRTGGCSLERRSGLYTYTIYCTRHKLQRAQRYYRERQGRNLRHAPTALAGVRCIRTFHDIIHRTPTTVIVAIAMETRAARTTPQEGRR